MGLRTVPGVAFITVNLTISSRLTSHPGLPQKGTEAAPKISRSPTMRPDKADGGDIGSDNVTYRDGASRTIFPMPRFSPNACASAASRNAIRRPIGSTNFPSRT